MSLDRTLIASLPKNAANVDAIKAQLDTKGFYLFHGLLGKDEVEQVRSTYDVKTDTVNYGNLTGLVTNMLMGKLNSQTGWDAHCVKYRFSNNNNASDAGTFHRDVIPITMKENISDIPLYTYLAYFDPCKTIVIPGSHKIIDLKHDWQKAIDIYRTQQLEIHAETGDCLIFNSNLLHCGMMKCKNTSDFGSHNSEPPKRRLIQMFETFPSQMDLQTYGSKVLHIPATLESHNNAKIISRIYNYPMVNYASYYNAINGYGGLEKTCNFMRDLLGAETADNFWYLSSEAGQFRLPQYVSMAKSNLYVTLLPTTNVQLIHKNAIVEQCYSKQLRWFGILMTVLILLFIFLFIWLIRKLIKRSRGNNNEAGASSSAPAVEGSSTSATTPSSSFMAVD